MVRCSDEEAVGREERSPDDGAKVAVGEAEGAHDGRVGPADAEQFDAVDIELVHRLARFAEHLGRESATVGESTEHPRQNESHGEQQRRKGSPKGDAAAEVAGNTHHASLHHGGGIGSHLEGEAEGLVWPFHAVALGEMMEQMDGHAVDAELMVGRSADEGPRGGICRRGSIVTADDAQHFVGIGRGVGHPHLAGFSVANAEGGDVGQQLAAGGQGEADGGHAYGDEG